MIPKVLFPSQERYYFIFLFLLGLTYCLLRPIDDLDLFTQLKLGELSWQTKSLVTTEPFSYLNLGQPIQNPGWLAQIIFFLLSKAGSWGLLRYVSAAIISASFILALASTRDRLSDNRRGIYFSPAAATALALIISGSNNGVRPQIFSLIGFSALMLLRSSRGSLPARLVIFAFVALVWQNCHPSLMIAAAWIGTDLIGRFLTRPISDWADETMRSMLFLCVVIVCSFLTPLGFEVFSVSKTNLHISRDVLAISEWMPPWHPSVAPAMAGFWLTLTAIAIVAPRARLENLKRDGTTVAAFIAASFYSARFTLYLAPICAAFLPIWIETARRQGFFSWAFVPERKITQNQSAYLLALFCASICALVVVRPIDRSIPLDAALKLRSVIPEGRIYNYREWGGILTYAGFPEWRVTIDGRLYLYDEKVWSRYSHEAAGNVALPTITQRHVPRAFFLHKGFDAGLIRYLRESRNVELIHEENEAIVFLNKDF